MEHKQVLDLIPAYALGALDSDELQQVEDHLGACMDCQAELHAYQRVVDGFAHAVTLREPPPALKQRIMARARTGAMERPASMWQVISTWFRRLSPAWSLFSLAMIVILAVSNIWLWQRLQTLEHTRKFQIVALAGTENSPEASGLLVISSNGMEGTLVVEHLPELDTASQYQLWLVQDGVRTSGGVFSVDQEGYANLYVESAAPLVSFDSFGITIEPYGGSPGPTGKKVLGGEK